MRHEFGYNNPQLIMIVQDEDRHSVRSLPFRPGLPVTGKDEARRIAANVAKLPR